MQSCLFIIVAFSRCVALFPFHTKDVGKRLNFFLRAGKQRGASVVGEETAMMGAMHSSSLGSVTMTGAGSFGLKP